MPFVLTDKIDEDRINLAGINLIFTGYVSLTNRISLSWTRDDVIILNPR